MTELPDLLPIEDPSQYKLYLFHLPDNPVSSIEWLAVDSRLEPWKAEYAVWERKRIFALHQFGDNSDLWMFGGAFKVVECYPWRYVLEDCPEFIKFMGRVVLRFHRYPWMQGFAYRLEDFVKEFEIVEFNPQNRILA